MESSAGSSISENTPGDILTISRPQKGHGQGVGYEGVPGHLPYQVEPCDSSDLCSQKPHCRLLFLLSRFLVWPTMLQ